ncbi:glycosyltransferase family 4 protein [Leisingera thetidis]|uniref:glycosyltransferase family 4 protein n=1 Tax=Leisingera thetidis TaxID=2930199 RepID=UPI0021F71A97|nr:glycosyltransferase family 1 protein [Leisingera thetidis]
MSRRNIHINGRFLVQPVSGVQRYAREVLGALDQRLAQEPQLAARLGPLPVWYPAGAELVAPPDWRVLKPAPLAGRTGHAWEQMTLGLRARKGTLVSLCGSGPLLCRDQVLVIHDANIWAFPDAFPKSYRLFHKTMRPLLARRVRQLATVSRFSAGELGRCLGVPAERFDVIYNSAEHMVTAAGDAAVLSRHGLKAGGYLFAAGNQSPNKNIARLIDALAQLDDVAMPLVVAGGFAPGVAQAGIAASDRVRLLGRVSDAELQSLYSNAAAFLWPSLYEGFGIPPLEAMTLGTAVLSSNSTAMPEVLGDAVEYFDPEDAGDIARSLRSFLARSPAERQTLARAGKLRAEQYSWAASADRLLGHIL